MASELLTEDISYIPDDIKEQCDKIELETLCGEMEFDEKFVFLKRMYPEN